MTKNFRGGSSRAISASLLILLFLCSSFLLNRGLTYGHDLGYFLFRIKGIADGLEAGSFPVRIQTSQINGYGYPVGVMFCNWFYYVPAAFHLLGLSLENCYRLTVISVNMLTIAASYYSFSKLLSNKFFGVAGSYLYTLSCYRLMDITLRADVGEALAMAFFPCLLLSFLLVMNDGVNLCGKHVSICISPWALLGGSFAGVITANIPITVLVTLFILCALACGLLLFPNTRSRSVLLNIMKAGLLAIALAMFYILPFLDYYINADLAYASGYGNPGNQEIVARRARSFSQLFQVFPDFEGFANDMGDDSGYMPTTVGASLVLCFVVVSMLNLIGDARDADSDSTSRVLIRRGLFVFSCISLLMASNLFPWECSYPIIKDILAFLSKIQFSWRFVSLASFFIVAYALISIYDFDLKRIGVYVMLLLISVSVIESCHSITSFVSRGSKTTAAEFLTNDSGIYDAQFIPAAAYERQPDYSVSFPRVESGSIEFEEFTKIGSRMDIVLSGKGLVTLPALSYPYYEINTLEGPTDGVEMSADDCGRLAVSVNTQARYRLRIEFREPWYWRLGELISGSTLLALTALALHRLRLGHR